MSVYITGQCEENPDMKLRKGWKSKSLCDYWAEALLTSSAKERQLPSGSSAALII